MPPSLLHAFRVELYVLATRAKDGKLTEEEQRRLGELSLLLLEKYEVFLTWCKEAVNDAPLPAHLRGKR